MRIHSVIAFLLCLIAFALVLTNASAAQTVVVKKGDWIEYQVIFTGDSSQGHDVVWARMEIANVQEKIIDLNITTRSTNGTLQSGPYTLNLETGDLGDDFIIPANLNVGEMFYDRNQGNITISRVETKNVAGAQRTVAFGANPDTTYQWDKETGVLVEAYSAYPAYTIATKADKTNLWQPQNPTTEPTLICVLIVSAAIVTAVVGVFALKKRKLPNKEAHS
jgi:hypothetical protein